MFRSTRFLSADSSVKESFDLDAELSGDFKGVVT